MEGQIVKWVHYDNKLKEYAEKSKKLRQEKDKIGTDILENLQVSSETPKPDLPQFSIGALQTKVSCHQSTSYESLNYKFLKECFREYLQSEDKAEDLIKHIKQQRSSEVKVSLKRDVLKPEDPV
jgi:hypothetical protein